MRKEKGGSRKKKDQDQYLVWGNQNGLGGDK